MLFLRYDKKLIAVLISLLKFIIVSYLCILCRNIAVATHKYVISFCVGMELYNADTPKKIYAAYMLVYALMTSIGIAIGIVITTVTENDPNYLLTTGILQVITFDFK